MTQRQRSSNFLDMTEHPNLPRVRNARLALKMAERMYRAVVAEAMEQRPEAVPAYRPEDVAKAADVSRARVYQIVGEARAKAAGWGSS